MKDLFISDTHLGSPLFSNTDFILQLLYDHSFDRIFLVGDIFDVWEDNINDIVSKNEDLVLAMNQPNVNFIMGNHDPKDINVIQNILPLATVYSGSVPITNDIICTHGHHYDYNLQEFSWIIRISFYLYWFLERLLGIDIREYFRKFFSVHMQRDKDYYEDLVLKIEKDAVDEFKNNFKCMIMGHTHLPKISKVNNFVYVNSGDWIHSNTYVILEDNVFKLFKLNTLIDEEIIQ